MNFWKRYPADYQRKTARLTLAQHGAYTLLLDELYTTEKPLPPEIEELYRICRAMDRGEQAAVRVVADRFFPVGDDGQRHNKRAAEELEEAAPAVQAARENGRKGGRPKKPRGNPAGFGSGNPVGNPAGFQNKTQTKPSSKAPHSSDLRERESPPAARVPPASAGPRASKRCPADFVVTEELRDWAKEKAGEVDIERETEAFRDWTFRDAKNDWPATWRTWIRKASERAADAPRARGTGGQSFRERDAAAASAEVAAWTGGHGLSVKPHADEPTHPEEPHARITHG